MMSIKTNTLPTHTLYSYSGKGATPRATGAVTASTSVRYSMLGIAHPVKGSSAMAYRRGRKDVLIR
jgi:hypothetical protein